MDSRTEITGEKMDELRRLANAATPGPWGTDAGGPISGYGQRASIGVFSQTKLDDALDDGVDEDDAMSGAWLLGIWSISDEDRANAAYIAACSPDVILALLDRASSPARSAEGMVTVKPLTYDEVEAIILATEPLTLSDKGDKIWTRRMANALADVFNARLKALSAQPGTEAEAGETKQAPVTWVRCDECNGTTFAAVDERKPDGSFGPGPQKRCVNCKKVFGEPFLASRVQELEKALREISELRWSEAGDPLEDACDIAEAALTAKEA